MTAARVIPEHLMRRAYHDVRRPGWGSYDQALADDIHARLIRARATQLMTRPPPRLQPPHAPRSWTPARPPRPTPAPSTDRKRAAAGDLPDPTDPEDDLS